MAEPADHRVDRVAVGQRVGEPLEHHDADAVAADRAPGLRRRRRGSGRRATGSRLPGRGSRVSLREAGSTTPPASAMSHSPVEQALAGQVDGHQRGRAGGLHVDARARAGSACTETRVGRKSLSLPIVSLEVADALDARSRLAAAGCVEVRAHRRAGEDADRRPDTRRGS